VLRAARTRHVCCHGGVAKISKDDDRRQWRSAVSANAVGTIVGGLALALLLALISIIGRYTPWSIVLLWGSSMAGVAVPSIAMIVLGGRGRWSDDDLSLQIGWGDRGFGVGWHRSSTGVVEPAVRSFAVGIIGMAAIGLGFALILLVVLAKVLWYGNA
jgi:hypothetical protein